MRREDRHFAWFWSSCDGMADNASLFVEYLDGLDFICGEKHWIRGAVECLDSLMEGMVDYRRLEDLHFEVICWNWNYCRFYLAITKEFLR